eukprot:Gb_37200 [translate_table: standard]
MGPMHFSMTMTMTMANTQADGSHNNFPAGLRVLVVDDDLTCLKILEKMLRKCLYQGRVGFALGSYSLLHDVVFYSVVISGWQLPASGHDFNSHWYSYFIQVMSTYCLQVLDGAAKAEDFHLLIKTSSQGGHIQHANTTMLVDESSETTSTSLGELALVGHAYHFLPEICAFPVGRFYQLLAFYPCGCMTFAHHIILKDVVISMLFFSIAVSDSHECHCKGVINEYGVICLLLSTPSLLPALICSLVHSCLLVGLQVKLYAIAMKFLTFLLVRPGINVTTCCLATEALSMLREKKGSFDLVISDVYMPDIDGFKLLEQVGLEMDLPVIMMSSDGETSVVMKGIEHGACDYLIKPVRMEELQNIWQHVIRKKRSESKELDHLGSVEDGERHKKGPDDVDYASSMNEGMDWKLSKKRKEPNEDEEDGDQENDDPSSLKKPRVVWSVELHQQFVSAVNQLGLDNNVAQQACGDNGGILNFFRSYMSVKAVPKGILEMMNVPGLTRENVASHLQKYRLYLRKLGGPGHQQGGMNSSFCMTTETKYGSIDSLGRFDLHALVASGQISPQTLVALQSGLARRTNSNNGLGMPEDALLLQTVFQGVNGNPPNTIMFGQQLMNDQGNILQGLPSGIEMKRLAQIQQHTPSFKNVGPSMNDMSSGFSMMQQQLATADEAPGTLGQMCGINNESWNPHNNVLMMRLRQKQQQQQQHPPPPPPPPHQQQQLLQHQRPCTQLQSAQNQAGHILNLSSDDFLGPQVLSNEIGRRTRALSTIADGSTSINSVIGAPSCVQVNHISPAACDLTAPACSTPVAIGRRLAFDCKNNVLPTILVNNISLSSTIGLSDPLTTIGTEVAMHAPVLKNLGCQSDTVNSRILRDSSLNFCTASDLVQNINQSDRQGWQVHNTSQNLDFSQPINPVLGQGYSQSASGFEGLKVPHAQDQGKVGNLGSVGKDLGLSSRLASDAERLRSVSSVQCQRDETIVDYGLRLKGEDVSDLMGYSKMDGELLFEQFSSSYDITDLLFKQILLLCDPLVLGCFSGGSLCIEHLLFNGMFELCDLQQQEGVALADVEFGIDSYQLDNIHVI